MVAYDLGSNNQFVRCFDTESLWVYELDDLTRESVEDKSWTRLEGPVGPKKKYDVLKVGSKEIIGTDFRQLMSLLCHSRLIVNRQGICFFETVGITNSPANGFNIKYYKVKSLFDWSSYGMIKSPSDPSQDNQRIFERSGLTGMAYFASIVNRTRVSFPWNYFNGDSEEATKEFSRATTKRSEALALDEVLTPMDTKVNQKALPVLPFKVRDRSFDTGNWWLITVATTKSDASETDVKRVIYYDLKAKSRWQELGDRTIPVPFQAGTTLWYKEGLGIHMIHGVGVRFVFFV